jgi:hypothetical protein
MTPSPEPSVNANSRPKRSLNFLGKGLVWLALLGMTAWGTLAVYYSNLPATLRPVCAGGFAAVALGTLLLIRPWRRGLVVFGLVWALLLGWWFSLPPSNNRDWQPDVALLPFGEIEGNRMTIHNIRNCNYRTETDFDVLYYDKIVDLDQLRSVDLFLVYWGSPAICHTMLSFGFAGGGYICVSIETRKEKGEGYSTVKGFFRQFELTYVVADERDLVRLRTNYRGEQVYLYRLNAGPEVIRKVFLDYFKSINSLRTRPEWYNALTGNCTSNIRGHTSPYARQSVWSWKLVINGYLDELIYDNGAVSRDLPLDELKRRSLINARAKAADKERDFSREIRAGLPGMGS